MSAWLAFKIVEVVDGISVGVEIAVPRDLERPPAGEPSLLSDRGISDEVTEVERQRLMAAVRAALAQVRSEARASQVRLASAQLQEVIAERAILSAAHEKAMRGRGSR